MVKKYNTYNQGHDISVPLTVTEGAYTQYDVVGGLQTITKALTPAWHGCVLRAVTLVDAGAQSNAFKLYVFNQLPSTIANDAAWATAVIADLLKMPPGNKGIDLSAYATFTTADEGTVTIATAPDLNIGLDLRSGTASTFYSYLVDQETYDAVAVDDLTLIYHIWID